MNAMKAVQDKLKDYSLSNGHRPASTLPLPSPPKACADSYLPHPKPLDCFWQSQKHELHDHRSTEQLPVHSDLVIIGAGYAGTSTAWHLTHDSSMDSKSITILEARGACSGATGRNGGHLRPDMYGHIPTFLDRAGAEAAEEVACFEVAHLQSIKKLIHKEKIDCDFTLTRSIDVWCNEDAAKGARETVDRMVAKGFDYMDDVIFYDEKDAEGISGVKGAKACASYTAGTIWPYKFIMHLMNSMVVSGRINLQTNTPALSISSSTGPEGGFIVETSRGIIHASQIIHANNAYIGGLLPEYRKSIIPSKGICCRITVPKGTKAPLLNNSYINREQDKTLHYLVPRADGSIIVGGASQGFKALPEQWYNNTDDSTLIEAVKGYYDGYMQRTYRGWEDSGAKVDNIWSGIMGYTYDTHPHVGAVPGKPGHFVLGGFNGHGMPVIWQTAAEIAKMIAKDIDFEETGLPRLFKTTQQRLDRANHGRVEDGDILSSEQMPPTKQ